MKKTFEFFLRYFIFWWLIFALFRIIFIFSQQVALAEFDFTEVAKSVVAGYRLDLSIAAYFSIPVYLLTLIYTFGAIAFVRKIFSYYNGLLVLSVVLLSSGNIIIYKYWGTLLNNRGLAYVLQPKEMFASVSTMQIIGGAIALFTACYLIWKAFTKWVSPAFNEINGTMFTRVMALLLVAPLLVIGLRGGVQLIPVNESAAVYSQHRILNQIATNNIWYLGHNLKQSGVTEKNPYVWMKKEEAISLRNTLYQSEGDSIVPLITISKPNVVILLLESWTSDIIKPLGGLEDVTPNFSKLSSEGLLFTEIHSSGFRTDQAIVSVLSGFPAQPNKSIVRFPDKAAKLPSIVKPLNQQGYHSSFFYGGELGFANMNSYLSAQGFQSITGKDAFESEAMNSKWGAHDGTVLNYQIDQLNKTKEPFFSVLLTLSTHEPFEVPVATPFNGTSESEQFKKAAWYTDKCLGDYFEAAKKQPWYKNTLFVLVADHGHRLPLNRQYEDPDIRSIPLLFFGQPLSEFLKGKKVPGTGNQNDLAATLLAGLGFDHKDFVWSNNLLLPDRKPFAYLSLDDSFTWLTPSKTYRISLDSSNLTTSPDTSGSRYGKAYMQLLYDAFLTY